MPCLVKACVWPVVNGKLCAWHLQDTQPQQSFYKDRPFDPAPMKLAAQMLADGDSVRTICNVTRLREATVLKLRQALARRGVRHAACRCGKPLGHRGRCAR